MAVLKTELEDARTSAGQAHADLADTKKQAVEEQQGLEDQVTSLQEEKEQLLEKLEAANEKAKREEHDTAANLAEYRQATKDLQVWQTREH